MILVDGIASERQYEAPMVFGIISESTRMSSVRMAEMMPKYSSPNSFIDSAPTPAEPMVWAMVLSESIAPTGLSTLFLYCFISVAVVLPWFSFIEMNDMGVDKSTASRMEHKNDSAKAPERYNIIRPIKFLKSVCNVLLVSKHEVVLPSHACLFAGGMGGSVCDLEFVGQLKT